MYSVKFKLIFFALSTLAGLGKGESPTDPSTSASVSEAKAIKNYNWYPNSQHTGADYQYVQQQQQQAHYPSAYPLSRDSYVNAATDLGYGGDTDSSSSNHGHGHGHGQGSPNSYYPPQQQHSEMSSYGSYGQDFENDEDGGGGGLGGSVGLLGLLGLKGLKAIKFAKALPFLPLLLPLLLPFLLPIIALPVGLLIVAALFIPIPLLVVPGGRSSVLATARVAKDLALSEDCLERVTCETTRFAKGYGFDAAWIQRFLERTSSSSSSNWIKKVSRGVSGTECKQYTCNPITSLKKSLKLTKSE